MWGTPPGVKKPWPALTVIGSQAGARSRMTSPAFTTEYSGPGWVCQPELAPGAIVSCWMWKSLGLERWMLMSSVTLPTASSLRVMSPDGGVATAAVTPARLTAAHDRATSLTGRLTLISMVRPSPWYAAARWYDRRRRPFEIPRRGLLGSCRSQPGGGNRMTVHDRPFGRY